MNGGLLMWARSEWRHRWVALLLLALLVALGGGAAIAATAAAHRTDTAFDRMLRYTHAPNIEVSGFGETAISDLDPALLDQVMEINGVSGATQIAFLAVSAPELPTFFSFAFTHERGDALRPIYIQGSAQAHVSDMAADEVMMNRAMRDLLGVEVGEELQLESASPEQFLAVLAGDVEMGEPEGPAMTVRVVAVVSFPEEVSDAPDPFLLFSFAFYEKYRDQVWSCRCAVNVTAQPSAVHEVAAELADIYPDATVSPADDLGARLNDTVTLQSGAWTVMALVAAVAGLVSLLLACGRLMRTLTLVDASHRALGMTRRASQVGRFATAAPTVIIGTAGAGVVAYALSPLAPVGITSRAEPEPGLRWEWAIGGLGLAVVLASSLLAVAICAVVVRHRTEKLQRVGRIAGPVVSLSGRLALGPGRGAVVGSFIAALGAVGALTLNNAIEHDLATPAVYGADYDAEVFESVGFEEQTVGEELAADPDIEAVGHLLVSKSGTGNDNTVAVVGPIGEAELEPSAIENIKGSITPLTIDGRAPLLPDEVAIGSAAMKSLGASIGDVVTVTGARGTRELSIVGTLVSPGVDSTDVGLAVTVEGLDLLVDGAVSKTVVRFAPGVDHATVIERHPDFDLAPVAPPSEVYNLGEIGGLPNRVAQLLVILGITGLLNAIFVTVSQGRRQVAIHRALGFTSRQVIGTHVNQHLMAVAVGATIGGISGYVVGRAIHHELVDNIGLIAETTIPAAVVTVAAVALVVALAAGATASALALRQRPGVVLRAE